MFSDFEMVEEEGRCFGVVRESEMLYGTVQLTQQTGMLMILTREDSESTCVLQDKHFHTVELKSSSQLRPLLPGMRVLFGVMSLDILQNKHLQPRNTHRLNSLNPPFSGGAACLLRRARG